MILLAVFGWGLFSLFAECDEGGESEDGHRCRFGDGFEDILADVLKASAAALFI